MATQCGRWHESANTLAAPMTTSAVQSAFEALVDAIRAEVREEFLSAIGGARPAPAKRRGRKPGPKPASRRTLPKGGRRSPEELEALTAKTLAAIKKAPGLRAEELAVALGVSTKELVRPVTKLFDQKAIKTTGQRRGTKYFPK